MKSDGQIECLRTRCELRFPSFFYRHFLRPLFLFAAAAAADAAEEETAAAHDRSGEQTLASDLASYFTAF